MRYLSRQLVLALVLSLTANGLTTAQQPAAPTKSAGKHALIVGCTKYPNCDTIPSLNGPANDSRLWKTSLARFGFEGANVESLVGWPDDPAQRPTHANITQAFERLIQKAGPGVQFFILISGHGTQVPTQDMPAVLKDPSLQELDGLDEVFLPADAKSWNDGRLENTIRDDQFGAWLQQLRDRGADVWIVFDCCHSGTMTRGDEVMRSVNAVKELGVPAAAMQQARQKAAAAQAQAGAEGSTQAARPEVAPKATSSGSVVALYAAQPFEETPELPRPASVKRAPENYFGLLSYTVNQVMEQRRSPISYREMMQLVMAAYCAERGTRGPTPFAEGDLDREVLGQKTWPNRADILLQVNKRELHLTAGQLQGLQNGSILTVHPAPGAEAPDTVLGHVRVLKCTPTSADVEVCAYAGQPAVDATRLPNLGRCEVVFQDLGDARIQLAADNDRRLTSALDQLPAATKGMIVRAADAAWRLRIVSPDKAPELLGRKRMEIESQFKVRSVSDWAVLEYTGGVQAKAAGVESASANSAAAATHHLLAVYPADEASLGKSLARDLPKLFAWQNIWRVSGLCSSGSGTDAPVDVQLHVTKLKNADDPGEGEPLSAALAPGDVLRISLENKSRSEVWVTQLFLDARLGIMVESMTLQAYESTVPRRFSIFDTSFGPEGFVIFAGKLRSEFNQGPNLMTLAQSPLGEDKQSGGGTRGVDTPFGRLLEYAASGQGGSRGSVVDDPGRPVASSCTWLTVPKGK